jgi:ATP-dependent helicase/nuclease subunit A
MKLRLENQYEELRILYVAFTRAKEKLILTGTVKTGESTYSAWKRKAEELTAYDPSYTFADLEKCTSYLDMIVPVAMKASGNTGEFEVVLTDGEQVLQESKPFELSQEEKQPPSDIQEEAVADYFYPYESFVRMKSKMTVTELKQQYREEFFEEEYEPSVLKKQEEPQETVPAFLAGSKVMKGTDRGTAYHRVMECFDYACGGSPEQVRSHLSELEARHMITHEQFQAVDPEKIFAFFQSGIAKRIQDAITTLKREQPFVYAVSYDRKKPYETAEYKKEDSILVQGIIDSYFEEDGKLVIVDYKTDQIKNNREGKEQLIKRYQIQLDFYADALQRSTGLLVKQKVIYSFCINEEIIIA